MDFRLARESTTLGQGADQGRHRDHAVPGRREPGSAQIRGPRRIRIDRKNVREHITFGRDIPHTCAGAPARVEEPGHHQPAAGPDARHPDQRGKHGAPGHRNAAYEPTFLLRGLLHIRFTEVSGA